MTWLVIVATRSKRATRRLANIGSEDEDEEEEEEEEEGGGKDIEHLEQKALSSHRFKSSWQNPTEEDEQGSGTSADSDPELEDKHAIPLEPFSLKEDKKEGQVKSCVISVC